MSVAEPDGADLAVLRRAFVEMKHMRARLEAIEHAQAEPIAIVGMSCRFPGGANDVAGFWRLLRDGVDAIAEVPPDRWDVDAYYDPDPEAPGKMYTRWGGFLRGCDLAAFDAQFFGISPREAAGMDPQQRLLLEVAWEALEDAGLVPPQLVGSRTGVFVGISTNDYSQLGLSAGDLAIIDAYSGTGNTASVAAGRISYVLGLQGPCFPVDTACSSSLVTVHLACGSLRSGECDVALVGGVNAILTPENTVFFSKLRAMAPDGRCKSFDARADGYVRGEGCGVVVLKRLTDALADGNPVLALVRGTAVNHDGRSNGLTAPNGAAQQAVIREALANARVAPAAVGYVEAHGTGTPLGDPVEVEALAAVLGQGRPAGQPFAIGSVKTNIGHLEAAAGIAGLIKTVLALQHREIPPHLHLAEPSPLIPWKDVPATIPTALTPWPDGPGRRVAGVSSFGFSGTNAHVILEEAPPGVPSALGTPGSAPAAPAAGAAADEADREQLLPLSARTPAALRAVAAAFRDYLRGTPAPATTSLGDVVATAALRRAHHEHRLALVARTHESAAAGLDVFLSGQGRPGISLGSVVPGPRPKTVFVFPGQGSQWPGMARRLLADEPIFRTALEACDAAIAAHAGLSVAEALGAGAGGASTLDQIDVVQPVLFAVQVALAALWRAWGITPDAVVGHSMGEVAAAVVAGALTLDDGARVICRRSHLLRRVSGRGAMALVELPLADAQEAAAAYAGRVSVAASNGPRATILSGEREALALILAELERREVFCRWVKVDVASHGPQVDELRDALLTALQGLAPRAGTVPIYSTVRDAVADGHDFDASYWVRNLRDPVLFWPAIQRLADGGHRVFVEVSPHPILLPSIEDGLRHAGRDGVALPSLRRDEVERTVLLESLGRLYTLGCPIDFRRLVASSARFVPLPAYPWQKERHWHEQSAVSPASNGAHGRRRPAGQHPLLGRRTSLARPAGAHLFDAEVDASSLPFLRDHRIQGTTVVPGAAFLEMAFAGTGEALGGGPCVLRDVEFAQLLVLPEAAPLRLQVTLTPTESGTCTVDVYSRQHDAWIRHAGATVHRDGAEPPKPLEVTSVRERCAEEVPGTAFYARTWERGIELGASFRGIQRLWRGPREVLAEVGIPEPIAGDLGAYRLHPALLDQCLQVLAAIGADAVARPESDSLFMPVGVQEMRVFGDVRAVRWGHAQISAGGERLAGAFAGDVRLLDDQGRVLVDLRGLRFQNVDDRTTELVSEHLEDWLYEIHWPERALPPSPAAPPVGDWLIIGNGERDGMGHALCAELRARGESVVLADPEDLLRGDGGDGALGAAKALDDAFPLGRPPRCVIHLHSLGESLEDTSDARPDAGGEQVGCRSALALVQALSRLERKDLPRLVLVTRGAQPAAQAAGDATPVAAAQAPLWGLGRTIARELPELRCTLVDLDPARSADGATATSEAHALLEVLLRDDGEDQIALRRGDRRVARLARCAAPPEAPSSCIREDGTYLITGGLGGLGLAVAAGLAQRGARHLALIGRRDPSPVAELRLEALREAGVRVVSLRADVARREELAGALRRAGETLPPLRGVVHAAGVLDDGVLPQLTWERFAAVLAPKVAGAWHLHALTQALPLDFFVLFSSAAALLGAPGQASYAAANAFLDALAHHRRARGLPALSINWGPWAGVGLASASANRATRLASRGLASIVPERGVAALWRLLGLTRPEVGVVPLNLRQWQRAEPRIATLPVLADLMPAPGGAPEHESLRQQLEEAEPWQRAPLLEAHLREQIAAVLKLDPARIGAETALGTLGFDSLMALELRNRLEGSLGAALSATMIWRYPTVGALVAHLATSMDLPLTGPAPDLAPGDAGAGREDDAALDGLSEAELAALLAGELAAIKGKPS